MAKIHQAKDPSRLARAVEIWVWIDIASAVIAAVGVGLELQILWRLSPDVAVTGWSILPGAMSQALVRVATLLPRLPILLITAILALRWVYRTSLNAHALAPGLTVSPAWAVGWYFVPVTAPWKPFQATREAWQASSDPAAWRSQPVPRLLRWWWALWLVSGGVGALSFWLSFKAHAAGALAVADLVELACYLVEIALAIAFILVVRRLTRLQSAALRRRAAA